MSNNLSRPLSIGFLPALLFLSLAIVSGRALVQYDTKSGRSHGEFVQVAFSATPTYDAKLGRNFKITLTGNVTSSTFVNASFGGIYTFIICQDSTGLRTHVWPTNVKGAVAITGSAGTCAAQAVVCTDSSSCYAVATGLIGL